MFYKLAEHYPDCLMLNFTIKVHVYVDLPQVDLLLSRVTNAQINYKYFKMTENNAVKYDEKYKIMHIVITWM